MKIKLAIPWLLLACMTWVAGFRLPAEAQTNPPEVDLSNPDVAAIVRIAKEQLPELYVHEDARGIADLYSSDIVRMGPKGVPDRSTKDQIEQEFRATFAKYVARVAYEFHQVQTFGDYAYDHVSFRLTLSPKAGGPERQMAGEVFEVLRKEDGQWKSFRVKVVHMSGSM